MPWECCGAQHNDDVKRCPACGEAKKDWTVEWNVTRPIVLSKKAKPRTEEKAPPKHWFKVKLLNHLGKALVGVDVEVEVTREDGVEVKDAKFNRNNGTFKCWSPQEGSAQVRLPGYEAKAFAPGSPFAEGGDGAAVFDCATGEDCTLQLEPLRVHLALRFLDPGDETLTHPLPVKGQLVVKEPGKESRHDVTFGADGVLESNDDGPGFALTPEATRVSLELGGDVQQYVAASPWVSGKDDREVEVRAVSQREAAQAAQRDEAPDRVFMLPQGIWGLGSAVWQVEDATWTPDDHSFTLDGDDLGSEQEPATLVLNPRWQYVRLTYCDRWRTELTEQVSSLPLLLDGFAEHPAGRPQPEELVTRSSWVIGDDADHLVQCVPWIRFDEKAPAPGTESQLRLWPLKPNTFLRTNDDGTRTKVVEAQDEPSAERLRYYDLPTHWRSRNWFVRDEATGTSEGSFFWQLAEGEPEEARSDTFRASKEKPLIFSLDDIVLCKADKTPLPALDEAAPVAIFHHSFRQKPGSKELSPEGLFLSEEEATDRGRGVTGSLFPASKLEVLGRQGDIARTRFPQLSHRYIVKYPDWTRLVTAEGNLHEVFADRVPAKSDAWTVGARAAVAWDDATAPRQIRCQGSDGTLQPPQQGDPTPGNVLVQLPAPQPRRPRFATVQCYVAFKHAPPNKRLDTGSSRAGAKSSASDIGPLDESLVGRRQVTYEEWEESRPRAFRGMGRFDLCFLRCCGLDPDHADCERAILFQFFRISAEFKKGLAADSDEAAGERKAWIEEATSGLNLRWNGPDPPQGRRKGVSNPGRPILEPRGTRPAAEDSDQPVPLRTEVLRFVQLHSDGQAAIRFQVIPKKGGRNWMNAAFGLSESDYGNHQNDGQGCRYTAAHELGHGGGLIDDYPERINHASYKLPGLPMLTPGDPYQFDEHVERGSMMHKNRQVRARHTWPLAEWVHARLPGTALQVRHVGARDPYFLPHNPANGGAVELRTYLNFPWRSILDADLGPPGGPRRTERFDGYLWLLGRDDYTTRYLAKPSPSLPCDSILILALNLGFDYVGTRDYDWVTATTRRITTLLRDELISCHANLMAGRRPLERCYVALSPRVIVGTHASNRRYDQLVKALPPDYRPSASYSVGDEVAPLEQERYIQRCTRAGSGPAGPPPAWPTRAGETVASAGYQWTTIRAERREKYDEVIRKKLRIAPLHAVVRVGAVSPKLDEARAGEHPRICLSTEDLLLLDQAAGHLREEVERLVRGVAEEIDRLTEEHRATFQTIRSLEGELAKTSDRARRKELSARKADEQRANDVREKDLAALEKVKRGMNPRRVVTEALDRTVEALQLLVENDETPLEGRASAELDEAANAAGEAAAADGSTRASVVRAVGGWSFLRAWRLGDSVTLKLTELLESLPHARSTKKEDLLTTRGDIAKVTRLFVEVLRQAWEFAEAGESYNDAPDRLKLALALLEEHRDEVKSGQPSPERSARLEELARHPTLEEQVQLRFCEYLGLQPEKPNEGVAALLTPFADDDNVDVRPFE